MPWSTDQAGNRFTRISHTAIDASGTNSSDAIDVSGYANGSIQMIHASHAADTSTWEVQSSNDGTNWDTVAGTSTTNTGASGSDTIVLNPLGVRQIRITITEASQATATLTPYVVLNKV